MMDNPWVCLKCADSLGVSTFNPKTLESILESMHWYKCDKCGGYEKCQPLSDWKKMARME